ncbi:thiosulfate oxidation carrier protein SoxY [Pseudomonas sp. TTU2014-080ASC]|uniref:thiosulfate oxidation carrier protein SoxY n=1 Tax=Pseudomonas sp. TTU2014-080ASC TaxID=1729724 RepID=UPI000718A601|nr:thiosulfate oxidation carrier protein SoxY [Pseudomonas sp. TTU2014-080ASC]KRW59734.1 hypothetical protein AO726_13130 [Pseudomonas sp. TTU2014-080ASC]
MALLMVVPLAVWARAADELVEQWLGDQLAQDHGLTLEVAPWVEDGAFVPLDISLSGAQAPVSILLLRSQEDEPRIASVEVRRWAEPLRLSTRIRLPQTQSVIVLARDGRGRVWRSQQVVEVLSSSCLTPQPATLPANFGQIQVWADGDQALELRTLFRHPMETGRRPNQAGGLIPRHLPVLFEVAGSEGGLMRVEPFEGLSVNPYWRLLLPYRKQALDLRWVDADGRQFNAELAVD